MAIQSPKNSPSSWYRRKWYLALPIGTLLVSVGFGCQGGLGTLLSLFLAILGVNPAASFGQTGAVDFNVVQMTQNGDVADENVEYEVDITDPPNTKATVEGVGNGDVEEVGTFSILIDSSGSMENSYADDVCALCPYDTDRKRVLAAQIIVKQVLDASPESRMGVFDFGPGATEGFTATRELQGYSSDGGVLIDAADKTVSEGGTFIYDSTFEILDRMNSDISEHFQTKPITKAVIVITDGEDTESTHSLSDLIAHANELEIPIHVVGIGKASAHFQSTFATAEDNSSLVADLRRLASETGGFYASVNSTDNLEQLANVIALGLTGGYDKVKVTLDPVPDPGTEVKGDIKVKKDGENASDAVGQSWSFIAP